MIESKTTRSKTVYDMIAARMRDVGFEDVEAKRVKNKIKDLKRAYKKCMTHVTGQVGPGQIWMYFLTITRYIKY